LSIIKFDRVLLIIRGFDTLGYIFEEIATNKELTGRSKSADFYKRCTYYRLYRPSF